MSISWNAPHRGVFVVAALMGLVPGFANAEWKSLEVLHNGGARVSASVMDLETGKTLQTLAAETRLSPASVTKLVVAAATLQTWPADKTFVTRVLGSGPVRDGRLEGSLILHGDGDATFDHRDLWALAGQLRSSAGISEISGGLIVSPAFGPLGCDNVDRCDALTSSDTAYNVPLASLGVDYGTWCIEVEPTAVGQPARLRPCGAASFPIELQGSIATVAATAKENFWVARTTREGRDALSVGGKIAMGPTQEVYRAMSDPAMGAGLLLRQMLVELGVRVAGGVTVEHGPPGEGTRLLARTEGLALREQLGRMLRYSNNYIADLLTLDLAAATGTHPPTQLGEASTALVAHLARSGAPSGSAAKLYSGSGLTPENELSAADLVAMLSAQYRDTRTFPVFYGSLVVPRQAPFAFLRGGSAAWQDRVALKTGTLNDPVSVCAVAGYLRKKGGGFMAFAILVNGGPKQKRVPLHKSMEAIRADIEDLLKSY
ncbi:MAG: D-alanyl-D-alanine carboxypeptidase/D-alanyl-D-alanine endopeptidase [Panacagrimonas sp.]